MKFVERPGTRRSDKRPVREIAGIPEQLIRHFSKRRAAIEDRYAELLTDYRHRHGHSPATAAQLRLAQQATLETRGAKALGPSFADKLNAWRGEAATVIGEHAPAEFGAEATPPARTPTMPARTLDQVAADVVEVVSAREGRPSPAGTSSPRPNASSRGHRFATPTDRDAATRAVVGAALSPETSVQLTRTGLEPPQPRLQPRPGQAVRRSNGEDVLVSHGAARYTTQDLLDAEQRLLDHAQQPTRHGLRRVRSTTSWPASRNATTSPSTPANAAWYTPSPPTDVASSSGSGPRAPARPPP